MKQGAGADAPHGQAAVRTVQEGECIRSIASDCGVPWAKIWEHASNSQLRDDCKDPGALRTGASMVIPPVEPKFELLGPERLHRFQVEANPVSLRLRILTDCRRPRVGVPYRLEFPGGVMREGRTGEGGEILEVVEPCWTRALLFLCQEDGETEESAEELVPSFTEVQRMVGLLEERGEPVQRGFLEECYELQLGGLEPTGTAAGVQARLLALGCAPGAVDGKPAEKTRAAVLRFQRRKNLEPTGELDDALREALDSAYDEGAAAPSPEREVKAAPISTVAQRGRALRVTEEADEREVLVELREAVMATTDSPDARDSFDALLLASRALLVSGNETRARMVRRHDVGAADQADPVIAADAVVLVSFGRVHVYAPGAWADEPFRLAKVEAMKLEFFVVEDAVRTSRDLALATLGAADRCFKAISEFFARARSPFSRRPRELEQKDFSRLEDELQLIRERLEGEPLNWWDLFQLGLRLRTVLLASQKLDQEWLAHHRDVLRGAEVGVKTLETVDWAAVQILWFAADVKSLGRPMEGIYYKIAIVFAHASAKGLGTFLSSGDGHRVFKAVLHQLAPDLVRLASDLLKSRLGDFEDRIVRKAFAEAVVDSCLGLVLVAYEHRFVHGKPFDKANADRLGREVGKGVAEQLANALVAIVIAKVFPPSFSDKQMKGPEFEYVRSRLHDALEEAIKSFMGEHAKIASKAEKDGKSFWDVYLPELPWLLGRLLFSFTLGVFRKDLFKQGHREFHGGKGGGSRPAALPSPVLPLPNARSSGESEMGGLDLPPEFLADSWLGWASPALEESRPLQVGLRIRSTPESPSRNQIESRELASLALPSWPAQGAEGAEQ